MELIIREKPNRLKCSGCPNTTDNTKIVSMDEYDCRAGYYCAECLIKAVLMVRPMPVCNQEMAYLLKVKLYADKGEDLRNNIKYENFINWLKPFLS